MVDFTTPNLAPTHRRPTHNFTIESWLAPKAAALTKDSTSGWQSPGATDPGSFSATETTSMNTTKLGATKFTQDHHINDQSCQIQWGAKDLTPFGSVLAGKTTAAATISITSYVTTTQFTVAVSGGTTTAITLHSSTGISGYGGKTVAVTIGTGLSAHTVFATVESIDGAELTLEDPLDEAPANGASVYFMEEVVLKKGGSRVKKWGAMFNLTGDFLDQLIFYSPENVVTDGNKSFPDADIGMTNFTIETVPQRETIDGIIQPVLLKEYIKFA